MDGGDPVLDGAGREEMAVHGVYVKGVDVLGVSGEHHMALVRERELLDPINRRAEGWRKDGPGRKKINRESRTERCTKFTILVFYIEDT